MSGFARYRLGLLLCVVAWPLAAAQGAERPALVGGTGSTPRAPIAGRVVLVDGERITASVGVDRLQASAGVEVIPTEDMTMLPGLWDMHVRLMVNDHADYERWDHPSPARFRDTIMPASAKSSATGG